MNTSSKTLIDRTERLLKEDENYRAILEKLFLLDNQHFERYFFKCSQIIISARKLHLIQYSQLSNLEPISLNILVMKTREVWVNYYHDVKTSQPHTQLHAQILIQFIAYLLLKVIQSHPPHQALICCSNKLIPKLQPDTLITKESVILLS